MVTKVQINPAFAAEIAKQPGARVKRDPQGRIVSVFTTAQYVRKEDKPRIFWFKHPQWKAGFWRVSRMPKPYTQERIKLWAKANGMRVEMNDALLRERGQQ